MQRNKKNPHTAMKTQYSQNKNKNRKKELSKDSYYTKKPAPSQNGLQRPCRPLSLSHLMSCHSSCLGGIVLLRVLETSFPTSGPLHIQFPLPKVFFSHPINLSSYYRATTHPLPQFLFFSLLLVFILLSRSYLVYLFTQLCPPPTLSCKL